MALLSSNRKNLTLMGFTTQINIDQAVSILVAAIFFKKTQKILIIAFLASHL